MKVLAILIDIIVLGGLVFGTRALMSDTFNGGGILTGTLIMGVVGAVFGLLRALYRKWLSRKMKINKDERVTYSRIFS